MITGHNGLRAVVMTVTAGLLGSSLAIASVLDSRNQIVLQHPHAPDAYKALKPLDEFVKEQTSIAWQSLLCNVGPGECVPGALPGVVVASPDTVDPPYFYTWTRDAALVMKYVTDVFLAGQDTNLEHRVQAYSEVQARLQSVTNPAGSLHDGSGLGEAKFKVNLRPYLRNWGRPQRDGPALRAITMMGYAKHLVENDQVATAREMMWPVIRNDLSYVAQYWNETGFDLWEEVRGSSFFTTAAQHRALVEGASLASSLGESCDECVAIAPHVLCFLDSYWSEDRNYAVANVHHHHGRSGKDINTILTSIHNFDPALGCDASTFQPCSDRALANHKAVIDSFRSNIYSVNRDIPPGQAVAIGRYPEDVYYNGNPWYLATLASAEQLYDALIVWKLRGEIEITDVSLGFFQDIVPGSTVGVYSTDSETHDLIVRAVAGYAEGYMRVIQRFTPENGTMSEQFDKKLGLPLSAHDLTWSYASFLTAVERRRATLPRSWASPLATQKPETCLAKTARGHYTAPRRTTFPRPPPPGATQLPEPPTAPPCDQTPGREVPIEFHERVETRWGESVRLVGNIDALGAWNVDDAVLLHAADYTTGNPVWKVHTELPWGEAIEYKFIKLGQDGQVAWEGGANHILVIPEAPCPVTTGLVEDKWQE